MGFQGLRFFIRFIIIIISYKILDVLFYIHRNSSPGFFHQRLKNMLLKVLLILYLAVTVSF